MSSILTPEDFRSHVPSPSQYENALASVSREIRPYQRKMLQVHYNARNSTVTAGELANAMGYTSFCVANGLYGKLGRIVAEALDLNMEFQVNVLADFEKVKIGRNYRWLWEMWPAVQTALEKLGWV